MRAQHQGSTPRAARHYLQSATPCFFNEEFRSVDGKKCPQTGPSLCSLRSLRQKFICLLCGFAALCSSVVLYLSPPVLGSGILRTAWRSKIRAPRRRTAVKW
jgi:hypothetical protein